MKVMRVISIVLKIIVIVIGFTWALITIFDHKNESKINYDTLSPVTRSVNVTDQKKIDSIYYENMIKQYLK